MSKLCLYQHSYCPLSVDCTMETSVNTLTKQCIFEKALGI